MNSITKNAISPKKARRMAREPKPVAAHGIGQTASEDTHSAAIATTPDHAGQASPAPKAEKSASKASLVLEMLQQPAGATIEHMVAATGWLPHTTRAVLTGFKKKGHVITSEKVDGGRTYRIAAEGHQFAPPHPGDEVVADA